MIAITTFFAGMLLAPSKEVIVYHSETPSKPELRTLECDKLVVVAKGRSESQTVIKPNWVFAKIPDSLGGQNIDEEQLRLAVEKHLNDHCEEFFGSKDTQIYVIKAEVVEQGNVRHPDPNFAFVDVQFAIGKGS